ncbi:MAG TPA: ATP-binding protein [Candidatus Limnocylindrales bacterium]|nr:ATP-binding protein [Candidatus Limnocylindrales bacterium]
MSADPEIELLNRLGGLFTGSLSLDDNIEAMLRATSQMVVFDAATVFLLNPDGRELIAIATYPHKDEVPHIARFTMGEGILGFAVQQQSTLNIADATQDPRFKSLDQSHSPRSLVVQPLATPQRVVGAMTISRQRVDPFTELDAAILKVITNQAAIAIDNGRLYEQLEAHLRELEAANAQIAEVSRLKSEFLANMSHELRTPLNAILGFSELLRDDLAGKITEKQRKDCLDNIHNSGKHLLSLINDVLDLTKIEAGRMDLVYEEFGVESALREVLNVVNSLAMKKEIDITSTVEPRDLVLIADKNKFKQVLYNLLSNAIKFTPQGGGVQVSADRLGEDRMQIRVKDSGIGIPAEQQHKIFGAFYQVQSANNREYPGTGLGLALTRRLLELHGGSIEFQSAPGQGTTFTAVLPLKPGPSKGNRVLVVEDNPSNLDLARMVLEGNGLVVDTAATGPEGLEKARHLRPDLILMDMQLPGVDGLAVTRQLKADPATAHIKVVALTANALKGSEEQALAAGCTGYIAKPIELKKFMLQVTNFLEKE